MDGFLFIFSNHVSLFAHSSYFWNKFELKESIILDGCLSVFFYHLYNPITICCEIHALAVDTLLLHSIQGKERRRVYSLEANVQKLKSKLFTCPFECIRSKVLLNVHFYLRFQHLFLLFVFFFIRFYSLYFICNFIQR